LKWEERDGIKRKKKRKNMIKTNNEIGMRSMPRSLNIGFENRVISKRIIAIVNPNSAPIKRMIKELREKNLVIDATSGKPTRSVVIMDSEHIVLSSISSRKLSGRIDRNNIG